MARIIHLSAKMSAVVLRPARKEALTRPLLHASAAARLRIVYTPSHARLPTSISPSLHCPTQFPPSPPSEPERYPFHTKLPFTPEPSLARSVTRPSHARTVPRSVEDGAGMKRDWVEAYVACGLLVAVIGRGMAEPVTRMVGVLPSVEVEEAGRGEGIPGWIVL